MSKLICFFLSFCYLLLFCPVSGNGQTAVDNALLYRSEVVDTFFGTPVSDPYRWLENVNSDSTQAWLKEQRSITKAARSKFGFVYTTLSSTIKSGVGLYTNILEKHGPYYFHLINLSRGQPPVLRYRTQIDGDERDDITAYECNSNSKKGTPAIGGYYLAPDNKHLAVSISYSGSDWREIRVRNLSTGNDLPDVIKWVKFSNIEWYDDGFFYLRFKDVAESELHVASNTRQQLCYHKLGQPQQSDLVVYNVSDYINSKFDFEFTPSHRYLMFYTLVKVAGKWCNVVMYKDMQQGLFSETKLLLNSPAENGFSYEVVDCVNDKFIVKTDCNAPNGAVWMVHKDSFNRVEALVPQFTEVLKQVTHIDKKIFCLYFANGLYKAITFNYDGEAISAMKFDSGVAVSGFQSAPNEHISLFYQYSFYLPPVVCTLNLKTNKADIVRKTYVHFEAGQFTTKIVTYKSKDGTEIPMYLTYKKNLKLNKTNPVLLYGYGGFGVSLTPFFDYGNVLFCASGGILAVPLIRGGGERGKVWHEQGCRLNKQNSFDDFAAAATYLVDNKLTTKEQLCIQGASNGGLLVGAMLTQHPELFGAAVAQVGVYDMLRYHLFTAARFIAGEYGTVEDSVDFENLLAYSPYHNIKPRTDYPATLVITADTDERVPPFHSYKFLARLQQTSQSSLPHILYFEEDSGHSGGVTMDAHMEQMAVIWSFVYKHLNMTPASDF